MAVVDKEDRLLGMITVYDIVDIIEQENTEDFQKMAAMQPNEQPYLKTPVLELARHRVIWLLVLMISATLTGSIIKRFDDVIQSVVILAAIMASPLMTTIVDTFALIVYFGLAKLILGV